MARTLALLALAAAVALPSASAVFDWGEMSNVASKQTGDATFYGQDPDQVRRVGGGGREMGLMCVFKSFLNHSINTPPPFPPLPPPLFNRMPKAPAPSTRTLPT
jgi:hypothetical protein